MSCGAGTRRTLGRRRRTLVRPAGTAWLMATCSRCATSSRTSLSRSIPPQPLLIPRMTHPLPNVAVDQGTRTAHAPDTLLHRVPSDLRNGTYLVPCCVGSEGVRRAHAPGQGVDSARAGPAAGCCAVRSRAAVEAGQLCLRCVTSKISDAANHCNGQAGNATCHLLQPCQGDGNNSVDRGCQLASAA